MADMFKVPSDDQSLRISMVNLKLKDKEEEEYVSRNQYQSSRWYCTWNRIHSAEAQPDETEKVEQLNRRHRMTLTKKGREYGTEASFIKKKREAELKAQSFRLEEEMAKAEAKVKIYEQEKLDARVQSEKLVVTEEPEKTSKYTWDGPLLKEQRDQRKNYVILRDRHQRDMKNGNKEGKELTTTQSALNIDNQNEMIDRSYHDTGIPPRCTDGIRLMLCRLIEEQSPPDVETEEFDGNTLNFNCFKSTFHKTVQWKIDDPQGRLN